MVIYLSLGSNISPRHQHLDAACQLLAQRCGTFLRRSNEYHSLPVGYSSDAEYINIAVALQTHLSPMDILTITQSIEKELGRTHKSVWNEKTQTFDYQDRTIDIDLIQAFDDLGEEIMLSLPNLILPHPRMLEREFVLIPLQQILE